MHTVMLIDDDYLTLLKLKRMFPWEKYSFRLVHATTDPHEALKYLTKLNPDVVFTDISMYAVDGFDVIEFAKRHGLKAKFVIISGYDNFGYAQRAIRHGVVEYLLKPVTPNECERILSVLKAAFDHEDPVHSHSDVPQAKFQITNQNFRQLVEFVNKNYMESLSLSDLSQMFHLNLSYCCQLFQKYFNCNFSDYVISLKMKKAAELLSSTQMKTSEIAEFLNYDYSHFCKRFKKYFGLSPFEYKKTLK